MALTENVERIAWGTLALTIQPVGISKAVVTELARRRTVIPSTAVVILGSIFGLLVLLCSMYVCIYLVRRHRRVARYGRLVTSQGSTLTSTIRFTGQRNPPPYLGENPSSYPYYPQPQYEQHQTIIASPYLPELTKLPLTV